MTEKELAKLRRHDLLALLVAQSREAAGIQAQLEETDGKLAQALELDKRLRARLDEKDQQIERLKDKLNEKDAQLARFVEKLNEKDAQIERLKAKLNDKDRQIELLCKQVDELNTGEYLRMESAESLSEVTLRLNLMMRAAQKVVDRYLHDIKNTPAEGASQEGNTQNL